MDQPLNCGDDNSNHHGDLVSMAAEDEKQELAALRMEMDAMHDIMGGGCCPINSRGDKDIYNRKFSLPVSTPAHHTPHLSSSSVQP